MDSGGGGDENYWPGFVDALANVVLTLIFVLIIFVFALTMASNKVEQRMREVVEAEKAQKSQSTSAQADPQKVEELQQQLEQAQAELAALKQNMGKSEQQDVGEQVLKETDLEQSNEVQVEDKGNPKQYEGAVDIRDRQGMLTIDFPAHVSQMDETSQAQLGALVTKIGGMQANKIVIKSFMGKETVSAAQRTAYYRAINVRNYLITKLSADPSIITAEIVKPDAAGIGRVEIVFRK